jgi:flavin reductase (DIM6/NTAB) family NADH-FMN oxidoreductase RutF
MHYDPRKNNHNLPHDPFTALVVPRPIGWISTVSRDGIVNLAPYSFFNAVASRPPYVMFSSATRKDSQRNAEETGEFVHSLATWELREEMNITSAGVEPGVSEPELARLEMAPSVAVRPPRVKKAPIALECKYVTTVKLAGADGKPHSYSVIFGEVVSIYIDDALIVDGIVDLAKARPITRLGYLEDYAVVNPETMFKMKRPA